MSPAIASGANRPRTSIGCSRFACASSLRRPPAADRRFSPPLARLGAGLRRAARPQLPESTQASDAFFGRGGKLMALSQIEQALKFELLVPVRSVEDPTACMSFNNHRDHFGNAWNLAIAAGR